MSKLKSLLQQDYEESTSMETFDVVVPLRITQSQTSIAIQIEGSQATQQEDQQQQQQQISATLRNSLIALDINTPRRAPLQITNADVTNDESTFAVLDTPCFKYAIPKFTPVLCRLNAHRSEYDLSNFDIKQPKFILPPPSAAVPPTTLSQPTQASSRVTPPTTNTTYRSYHPRLRLRRSFGSRRVWHSLRCSIQEDGRSSRIEGHQEESWRRKENQGSLKGRGRGCLWTSSSRGRGNGNGWGDG